VLLVVQMLLPTVSSSVARTISWSGYTWELRPTASGAPGPNQWSDSDANVHVDGSDLVLSIVKDSSGRWTSAEVDNQQHLGYGTYRWVVATDLSALDANEVLGMFTYGGTSRSNNEIDLEPSHWGNLSWPTGSATVWQDSDAGLSQSKAFDYTNRPPYVHQFTWLPGKVTYLVTDASGATLFSWVVTSGVPTPSSEVPMINYWRFDNVAPATARSMRIASFAWAPPGQDIAAPVGALGGAGASPAGAGAAGGNGGAPRDGCAIAASVTGSGTPADVRVQMRPRRFATGGGRRGATISWNATKTAHLRLVVERLAHARFVTVGTLTHAVHAGSGRLRFTGRIGTGRRLRAGAYRLVARLVTGASSTRCTPRRLRFTIVKR
jgi:hypothetical protein